MLKKNDDIPLFIEDYTSEGNGIGRYEGFAVFVSEAAVGDTVLCHIIKVKSSYAIGKLLQVLSPSKDRRSTDCRLFPKCGGCAFRHITYEAELKYKGKLVSDAFLRIGGIDLAAEPIIGAQNIYGYRNKAQLPVKMEDNVLKIGFYAPKSHRVIDGGECALHPRDFFRAVKLFKDFICSFGISVYDETTHKGLIRHLYLRKAFAANELMVCVVINGDCLPHAEKLTESLRSVPSFKTLVLNINKASTNVVLGTQCKTLFGPGWITDELCHLSFKLSPLTFYQVNPEQAQLLYQKAGELAECKKTDTLLDLYCGTGTIGLTLAKNVKQLIGVEIIESAVSDAIENSRNNRINNARFIRGDAKDAAAALKNEGIAPNIVILDPPRKGCDKELLKTVSDMNPEKIIYVSCDPATLARDCKILKETGYTVKTITPIDLFPRTVHVETVVLMSRVNDK